jgi:nucleotide-binding universal stress UspA family protein
MRILHPTDFSKTAEKAGVLALDLSRRLGGELTVVHVHEPFEKIIVDHFPLWVGGAERLNAELKKEQEENQALRLKHLNEALVALTPAGAKAELRWGKPLAELLAILPDYDLVVMGAHGANRLDNYFLGGVAGRLVRRSRIPVLTVREECGRQEVASVLLASDFSEASKHALKFSLRLAEAGVTVAVAHVIEVLPEGKEDAELAKEAVSRLKAFSERVNLQHLVRGGNPIMVLPELADEIAADAIVIGVKRHSAAMGLFLGSRADALIRSSPVPILSVPLVIEGDRL